MTVDVRGHIVVVTGAGRGLGAAYARLLARLGAVVVVHDAGVDRDGTGGDPALATAVASELEAAGLSAEPEVQDLSSQEGCRDLVGRVLHRHGRIDALVHNAGIVRYGAAVTTTDSEWEAMLAVNVSAPWWLTRAVWPGMADRGYGRIVLTTSGFALRVIPGADVSGYSVGKAAQVGLMNGLAAEGRDAGILVNCVEPVAATRIFRSHVGAGQMTAEAVAPAVAMLASPECRWSGLVVVAQDGEFAFDSVVRTPLARFSPAAGPDDLVALAERDAPDLGL